MNYTMLILHNLHSIIIIRMFFIYNIHLLLTFMHIQVTAIQVTEFFIIKRKKAYNSIFKIP